MSIKVVIFSRSCRPIPGLSEQYKDVTMAQCSNKTQANSDMMTSSR